MQRDIRARGVFGPATQFTAELSFPVTDGRTRVEPRLYLRQGTRASDCVSGGGAKQLESTRFNDPFGEC